mgnify:CR=1 FL=1
MGSPTHEVDRRDEGVRGQGGKQSPSKSRPRMGVGMGVSPHRGQPAELGIWIVCSKLSAVCLQWGSTKVAVPFLAWPTGQGTQSSPPFGTVHHRQFPQSNARGMGVEAGPCWVPW